MVLCFQVSAVRSEETHKRKVPPEADTRLKRKRGEMKGKPMHGRISRGLPEPLGLLLLFLALGVICSALMNIRTKPYEVAKNGDFHMSSARFSAKNNSCVKMRATS